MNRRSILRRQRAAQALPQPRERDPQEDRAFAEEWTPLRFSHEQAGGKVYGNNRYTVTVRTFPLPDGNQSGWIWLSIHDHARTARHDWRDLQRIKNELAGCEREALEIYPPESRLVDTANEFHLWVMPEGGQLLTDCVGFRCRLVAEGDGDATGHPALARSKQRPFPRDNKPGDLKSPAEIAQMTREMLQQDDAERRAI